MNASHSPPNMLPDAGAGRPHARGTCIHRAGDTGPCWRIRRGAVRLDRVGGATASDATFAGILLAGDLLGAEAMLFGAYVFTATAIETVEIEAWTTPAADDLLRSLASAEQRTADVLRLRAGDADTRVRHLLQMLASVCGNVSHAVIQLPSLRDMADFTGMAQETVSRVISQLRRQGLLQRYQGRRAQVDLPRLRAVATLVM